MPKFLVSSATAKLFCDACHALTTHVLTHHNGVWECHASDNDSPAAPICGDRRHLTPQPKWGCYCGPNSGPCDHCKSK